MPLTRLEVTQIYQELAINQQKPELARAVLQREFSKRENIGVFGWFCFPEYAGKSTPGFHADMWDQYEHPGMVGIAAPRGHAKSTATDVIYVAWMIANVARLAIYYVILISDTYTLAVKQLEALAEAMTFSPTFLWLYGDQRGDQWSENILQTRNGCQIQAMGKGQQIRGSKFKQHRPKFVILDDVENAEELRSAERREFLQDWVLGEVIPAMDPNGTLALIGTVLSDDSLLQNVLNGYGAFASWRTLFYQALNYREDGSKFSLWPEMWDPEDLYRMGNDPTFRRFIGSIKFSQEYQNKPRSDKDRIFKGKDIQWCDAKPESTKYTVIAVDPAISKKDTADFTAKIAASLGTDNKIYVHRIGNDKHSFTESETDIRLWYAQIKPNVIGVEVVAFQEALREVLAGLPIQKLEPDKDKIRRAIAISQYVEQGRIVIVRNIANSEVLFNQLTQFPTGAHDDLVDALVYAVNMLTTDADRQVLRTIPNKNKLNNINELWPA